MRIFETFAAGETKQFFVVGNFLRVASLSGLTSGSLDVVFFNNGKKLNIDLDNVDAGMWARSDGFDKVEVTSTVAQNVELRVNRGDVGSDRITGDVSVVDGGKARTLSGVAFMSAAEEGPVAAQYSHVQLWNPAASGKVVVCERLFVGVGTASVVRCYRHAAALTLAWAAASKRLGVAVSVAELRRTTNAAPQVTGNPLVSAYLPASASAAIELREPIVIDPGFGLVVYGVTVNITIAASFEFFEENV